MYDALPAVGAALIWAYASVAYRGYVEKYGVFRLNFLRLAYTSLILLAPALCLGLGEGALYAALSGVLSLALGDSLYLRALGTSGVSAAVPAAYSYIILEQFIAIPLGEPLRMAYLVAALLTVAGIYALTSGGGNLKGIAYALGAALSWSLGYAAIKMAGAGGMNPLSIAFVRAVAALPFLAWLSGLRGLGKGLKESWRTPLPIIAALDLGGGAALFAYSAVAAGLALSAIILGVVPLAAQLISRLTGKERPRPREYVAALLILSAVVISFI